MNTAMNDTALAMVAEEEISYKNIAQLEKLIAHTKKQMEKAAKDMDFMEAARLRDKMLQLQKEKVEMK